ncbi:sensor histidine kinase [Acidaminobacter sp. JC074]|uniref:tetratricopeptide repeat-containing sensor histidine kinase n=1 Tax=Acidaminobacter sp. JC074 TaxID=2530199 RepID=UPI001F0FCDC5|nr:tetratricopeptide repeat-containing sensor histidine kinase [Acidaminobacter sp. JC074]MCH4889457.1 sensor histidine kinase [Acidaminobacter sp. JC074]
MGDYLKLHEECLKLISEGQFDKAMRLAHELLDIYETEKPDMPITNVFSGREKVLINTPNAIIYITYMQRLIKLLEKQNSYEEMIKTMYYLGVEYISGKHFEEAEIIMDKAMKLAKNYHMYDRQADLLNGYGNMYELQNDDEKALEYYLMAYNMSHEYDYEEGQRFSHNIGYAYKKMGKYSKAIGYLRLCVSYLENTDMIGRMANGYNELGDSLRLNGQYLESHEALNNGLRYCLESKSNSFLKENYQFRSALYEAEGKFKEALEYFKLYQVLSENINTEKFKGELQNLRLVSELSSKESENVIIKEKNKELEAYSQALDESNVSLVAAIQETRLMNQKMIQSEKSASYNRMMIGVAHKLNTSISNISLMTEQIELEIINMKRIMENGTMTRKSLQSAMKDNLERLSLIRRSSDKMQKFIESIRSESITLDEIRKSGSIKHLLTETALMFSDRLNDCHCQMNIDVQEDMPDISAYNIFKRVINQLMDNALKYAFTDDNDENVIDVMTWIDDKGKMNIEFSDNGIGIEEESLSKIFDPFYTSNMGKKGGAGMGMYILQKTVQDILSGEVTCSSDYGEGTTIKIKVGNLYNSLF